MTIPNIKINAHDEKVHEKKLIMASKLLTDLDVSNHKGEKLGKIKDLMIDPDNATIDFAVMSFGGFWGMGERLTAIPWSALTLDNSHKSFHLQIDIHKLKGAPSFDSDSWPNMADSLWSKKQHSYYATDTKTAKHEIK